MKKKTIFDAGVFLSLSNHR